MGVQTKLNTLKHLGSSYAQDRAPKTNNYANLMVIGRGGQTLGDEEAQERIRQILRERSSCRDKKGKFREFRSSRVATFDPKSGEFIGWENGPELPGESTATRRQAVEMRGVGAAVRFHVFHIAPWISSGLSTASDSGYGGDGLALLKVVAVVFVTLFEAVTGLEVITLAVGRGWVRVAYVAVDENLRKLGSPELLVLGSLFCNVDRFFRLGFSAEQVDGAAGMQGVAQEIRRFSEKCKQLPLDLRLTRGLDEILVSLVKTSEHSVLGGFMENAKREFLATKPGALQSAFSEALVFQTAVERHADQVLDLLIEAETLDQAENDLKLRH